MPASHGVQLTFDNGTAWKDLLDSLTDPIQAISFGPSIKATQRVILYSAERDAGGAVYRKGVVCSLDGGLTDYGWFQMEPTYSSPKSIAIDPSDVMTQYAGGSAESGELFKTTDGWVTTPTQLSGISSLTKASGRPLANILAIAVHPTDPNTLYVGIGYGNDSSSYGIAKSTDGGTTWAWSSGPNTFGSGNYVYKMISISPKDPNYVMVTIAGSLGSYPTDGLPLVLVSTNGGSSWTEECKVGWNPNLHGVACAYDTDYLHAFAVSIGTEYPDSSGRKNSMGFSSDGSTFSRVYTSGLPLWTDSYYYLTHEVCFTRKGILYDLQTRGLYRSSDFGETWTALYAAPTRWHGRTLPDPVNPNYLWHIGNIDGFTGIFRSKDDGVTWTMKRGVAYGAAGGPVASGHYYQYLFQMGSQ